MKLIKNIIDSIFFLLADLPKERLVNFTYIGVSTFYGLVFFLVYQVVSSQSEVIKRARDINSQIRLSEQLIASEKKFIDDEAHFAESFKKNKPSGGIKDLLQKKVDELGLTVDSGWQNQIKSLAVPDSLDFDQERAELSIKKITTQQLVEFLQNISKDSILIVRELDVKHKTESLAVNIVITGRVKKKGLLKR